MDHDKHTDTTDEHHHEHVHVHMSPEQYATAWREAKDEFMRTDPGSPFGKTRSNFTGLRYFPYNAKLAMTLELHEPESPEPVEMGTSTGASREYPRAGAVHFDVEGQPVELAIFGEGDDLFLPLRDATSGKETYGAGRYVEPTLNDDGTVFLDLNLLYNPYCAYNEQFSCPLPPVENWLTVPIRAGEQVYRPDSDAVAAT